MQNQVEISCVLTNTDPVIPLGMEIWLDDQRLYDQDHVTGQQTFQHKLSDLPGEHELRFMLKNKLSKHTLLSDSGAIIKDATIIITDIKFDEIEVSQLVFKHAIYSHSQNTGFATQMQEKFYGEMGCNGVVSIKFTTPLYLWLLENL